MILLVIAILICGTVCEDNVVQMDNECVISFEVLVDCTTSQEDHSIYKFSYYNDKIERILLTRLTGVINLQNLRRVKRIDIMFGTMTCMQIEGNMQPVEIQLNSEKALTCMPDHIGMESSSISSQWTSSMSSMETERTTPTPVESTLDSTTVVESTAAIERTNPTTISPTFETNDPFANTKIIMAVVSSFTLIIFIIIIIICICKRCKRRRRRQLPSVIGDIALNALSSSVSEDSSVEVFNIRSYKRD